MRAKIHTTAFGHIEALVNDTATPVGIRLETLSDIIEAAMKAQRRLNRQLGVDIAKDLLAMGIHPSGRPVGEILAERERAAAMSPSDAPGGDR